MEKRYQVFVSSTFIDLQEERREVMQALLELDSIPSGMELFPAANEDQWTLIRKVIDDCDYYIVIVGGRYGSIGPNGLSFTEMEYRYALETKKPILGFVCKNPAEISAGKTEASETGREKLQAFRKLVQQRPCRFWETPADLGSHVSRSLIKLIKTHPAIGWVRGDQVPSQEVSTEILALRRTIDELEKKLASAAIEAPQGAELLSRGKDTIELHYRFVASMTNYHVGGTVQFATCTMSWDRIFSALAPVMINEVSERGLVRELNALIEKEVFDELKTDRSYKTKYLIDFEVESDDFQTVKVQLLALGLITKSVKNRSVKDTGTYWTLTPYGDNQMTKLRAISRTLP